MLAKKSAIPCNDIIASSFYLFFISHFLYSFFNCISKTVGWLVIVSDIKRSTDLSES